MVSYPFSITLRKQILLQHNPPLGVLLALLNVCFLHFNRLCHDFSDILDLHLVFSLYTLDAIVKHRDAERTGGSEDFSSRIQGLAYTSLIDTFANLFLHPGTTTAAATTEALVAIAPHLRDAIL